MNLSGASVASAYVKAGGTSWGKLVVVHDDLETSLGSFKLRQRGSAK